MLGKLKIFTTTEFFFLMFLFSGSFKEMISFPIDIGFFFLALAIVSTIIRCYRIGNFKKYQLKYISFILLLFLIVSFNLLINQFTNQSIVKYTKFAFLTLPSAILPILFIRDKMSIHIILKLSVIITTILAVISFFYLDINESGFIGFGESGYLSLGRNMATGFISCLYFLNNSEKKRKFFIILIMLLMSFVLLSTGSRMPIIALVITLLFYIVSSFRITNKDIKIKKYGVWFSIIFLIFLVIGIYYLNQGYFETFINRFSVLLQSDDGGASVQGRVVRFVSSMEMFLDNPIFGGGFGHFNQYYRGYSGVYPHNIILEFLSELGIIGLIWLVNYIILIIFNGTKRYILLKSKLDILQLILLLIFAYYFFNSMVTGDINDNRILFAFSSILIISPYIIRKTIYHYPENIKLVKPNWQTVSFEN